MPTPTPVGVRVQTLDDLQAKIRTRVFSPEAARGRVGVKIVSLASGKVIFESDAEIERCERWIDVFLSADVDIIGFEFDFTETVLWWLLQFRAKCIQRRAWPNALLIGSVRFHDIHGPKEATPIQLTRNELLRLFDVEVVSYPQQDWSSSYNAFIEKFTTNAQSISGPAWSKANF